MVHDWEEVSADNPDLPRHMVADAPEDTDPTSHAGALIDDEDQADDEGAQLAGGEV